MLPNGEFYDVKGIQLLENKLIGVRETHRLAITIEPTQWHMGKVVKKVVVTLKPERKFWLEVKKNTPEITWTRLENLALPGVPDLLGYNKTPTLFYS